MMLSWAGMTGVVSGMNEKGITVTINASKSSIPSQASTPVSLLAREILQYAKNIEQAYAIAQRRKMFVSESILIGSVSDGKSAIIEKSPSKYDIVFSETDHIICTNHFQGEAFKNDKLNIENILGSDSKFRFDRTAELLQAKNTINVNDAIAILRNRQGLGDKGLGLGNPLSVNQLIAHHSVVFKPSQQLVWVSTTPWQLGKFVVYDLNKVFSLTKEQIIKNEEIYTQELTIPADSFLNSSQYHDYLKFLLLTQELKEYSTNKQLLPTSFEQSYIRSNPELFLTYSHLGDYYLQMKDYNRANGFYQTALSKEVAGNDVRDALIRSSMRTSKKMLHDNTGN